MKILIVTPCGLPIPAVKGGAVLTLVESILENNELRNDFKIDVVASYDKEAKEKSIKYKNSNFFYIKRDIFVRVFDFVFNFLFKIMKKSTSDIFRKIKVINKIKKILTNNEYDKVVFENAGYLLNVLGNKKISIKYQNKLYYHIHNDIPDNINVNYLKQCKSVVISNYLRKKIALFCGEEYANNALLLPNGINTNLFSSKVNENELNSIRDKYNIEDKKVITYVGRIVEYKGVNEVIEAFNNLKRNDLCLMIVGSFNFGSKNTSRFENMIKAKIDSSNNIFYTGYIPYNEIYKMYAISNIVVLPSLWNEPSGLTMIEAACAKKPLVTTNVGGICENINKDYAYIIETSDVVKNIEKAITDIIDNYDEYCNKAEMLKDIVLKNNNLDIFYQGFVSVLRGISYE